MRTGIQDVVFITEGGFVSQFSIAPGCGRGPDKASHVSVFLLNFCTYAFVYDSCRRPFGPESTALASTTVRGTWASSLHMLFESCFARGHPEQLSLLCCSTSLTKNLHWLKTLYWCIIVAVERCSPADARASHPVACSRDMVHRSGDNRYMCSSANMKARNWDLACWRRRRFFHWKGVSWANCHALPARCLELRSGTKVR